VVAAFLVDPGVLSSLLHVNVDWGVLVFLLCATAALTEGRQRLAILFGLLASYSKESGALLYAALASTFVLVSLLPAPVPRHLRSALVLGCLGGLFPAVLLPWGLWSVPVALGGAVAGARLGFGRAWQASELWAMRARLISFAPLFIPPLIYGAHLAWHARQAVAGSALWSGISGLGVAQLILTPQVGPISRTYMALTLIVNFHWVMAVFITFDLLLGVRTYARGANARTVPGTTRVPLQLVLLFCAVSVYLVSRFETAVMARYVVPAFPFFFAAFLASLLRLQLPARARRIVLLGVVLLLTWSTRNTPDPVSRAVFGTYPFGSHQLLSINSIARLGGGYGLNQTIYNLEFLKFDDLIQAALLRLRPVSSGAVLVSPVPFDWLSIGALDSHSRRRLIPEQGVRGPLLYHAQDLATWNVPVDTAWFLEPAHYPSDKTRATLMHRYIVGAPDSIWVDGYAIAIRRLTRRAGSGPSKPAAVSGRQ
jgi:hypothetical protein